MPAQTGVPDTFYRVAGYHLCGPRVVRIDMLERLADMIRPLIAWRASEASPTAPPAGASGDGGFTILPEMMSILGCNSAELGEVLKALGFRLDRKPAPPKPVEPAAAPDLSAEPPAEPAAGANPAAESAAEPALTESATPAATAEIVEPPAAAAPAEPEFIDIWRPRRRYDDNRRDQPHRHRRRHHQDSDGGPFRRHRGSSRHGRWRGRSAIR